MPEKKPSILKQIVVGVAILVLSTIITTWLGLQDRDSVKIEPEESTSKPWHLVGTWRANVIELGRAIEITWHIRPDGTATCYFRSTLGATQINGTWRHSNQIGYLNHIVYEEYKNGDRGKGTVRWLTENQFEFTIIDNGIPAMSGLKRKYHRL